MNKRNIDKFFVKFNALVNTSELTDEQEEWLSHWKIYLAMSIIDDLGKGISEDICDLISTINSCG